MVLLQWNELIDKVFDDGDYDNANDDDYDDDFEEDFPAIGFASVRCSGKDWDASAPS